MTTTILSFILIILLLILIFKDLYMMKHPLKYIRKYNMDGFWYWSKIKGRTKHGRQK